MTGSTPPGDHRSRSWWDGRWRDGQTGWQLEAAAPPLVRLLDEERGRLAPGRVAVLGCGRGLEPLELRRRGFEVVGVDLSTVALGPLTRADAGIRYVAGDVRRLPLRTASLDHVLEHTCYCAIDPADRPAYEDEVARVLRPGGWLVALFYEPEAPGRPPFPVREADVRSGFSRAFAIERLERPRDSHPRRAGQEWLALLRRHGASKLTL